MSSQQAINLRHGQLSDLPELQQLFRDTIHAVCQSDYEEAQLKVWAAGAENTTRWHSMLTQQYVMVALINDSIVGFGTLDKGKYIDMFYVHKDYQNQGIASKLYQALEKEALRQGQTRLTADVSKTARPFFEKRGFTVVAEQTVVRQGVALTNFKMEKFLLEM
ncbi:GNAT family N-acetyltransferase [Emticicia agri]|uniref:GNAT family N-acetyltransferase n=1 Tax=Emticicia agri TaxID=2492393 RepID=A0A4Q5LWA8_9BACT|nr:GNAT family N-acetyltransferase [Emticicia agri]RYU93849.1 GNAT family N-acetyltransferase [Emticicia agri]